MNNNNMNNKSGWVAICDPVSQRVIDSKPIAANEGFSCYGVHVLFFETKEELDLFASTKN